LAGRYCEDDLRTASRRNEGEITVGIALGGWILIALGIVLAFTGKRLIWLAVGIAGFGVGWLFTLLLLPNVDPLARSLVLAVVGIAMAVVARRGLPIIGLALGAVLVGLFGMTLANAWFDNNTFLRLVGFAIGAAIGYAIVKASIDWGISLVTALGGGVLVWNGLIQVMPDVARWVPLTAGVVTLVAGFLAQRPNKVTDEPGTVSNV
jgi:hypothetical protein